MYTSACPRHNEVSAPDPAPSDAFDEIASVILPLRAFVRVAGSEATKDTARSIQDAAKNALGDADWPRQRETGDGIRQVPDPRWPDTSGREERKER